MVSAPAPFSTRVIVGATAALLLGGCAGGPLVAPLRYEPVADAPEEPFSADRPDASPVVPIVPIHFQETTLSNGLTVAVLERHELPIVTTQLVIARGLADLGARTDAGGILAELVGAGTKDRTSADLFAAFARYGALRDTSFAFDVCSLEATVAAPDLGSVVDLVAEMAIHPRFAAFPAAKLDVMRARDNSHYGRDDILRRNLANALVGKCHPYGFEHPSRMHADPVGVHDVETAYDQLFRPGHATLLFAGDVTLAEAARLAARSFGAWTAGPALPRPPIASAVRGPRLVFVDAASYAQAAVSFGAGLVPEEDIPTLLVLARVLGADASRLRGEVRVQLGATYHLAANVAVGRSGALLTINTNLDATKVGPALQAILAALAETRTLGVREADFERARTTLLAEWREQALTVRGAAGLAVQTLARGLPLAQVEGFPARIRAVTRADIKRLAERHLAAGAIHLVVVGDPKLRSEVESVWLGPATVRDEWGDDAPTP